MNLSIIQKSVLNQDYAPFLQNLPPDTSIACFGELAVSGCLYYGGEGVKVGNVLENLKSVDPAVMIGLPRREESTLFNSYLYHEDGKYQIYDKINLFEPMNETKVYKPGEKLVLFDSKFGKLGAVICFDLRFPELFSKLKEMGADYIFVPAAWPRVRVETWRELLVQRAIDNNVHVIGINSVGDDGTFEFGGSSMVVAPDGTVLAQADETSETVLEVQI